MLAEKYKKNRQKISIMTIIPNIIGYSGICNRCRLTLRGGAGPRSLLTIGQISFELKGTKEPWVLGWKNYKENLYYKPKTQINKMHSDSTLAKLLRLSYDHS